MSEPISLLRLPFEAEIISSGMPALILGFREGIDADWAFIVVEDGTLTWADVRNIRLPWRYDFNHQQWIDLKETNDTQDGTVDGGQSVPGSVSEPDEFGEGDPFDAQGRQAPGDPGNLDTGEDH